MVPPGAEPWPGAAPWGDVRERATPPSGVRLTVTAKQTKFGRRIR